MVNFFISSSLEIPSNRKSYTLSQLCKMTISSLEEIRMIYLYQDKTKFSNENIDLFCHELELIRDKSHELFNDFVMPELQSQFFISPLETSIFAYKLLKEFDDTTNVILEVEKFSFDYTDQQTKDGNTPQIVLTELVYMFGYFIKWLSKFCQNPNIKNDIDTIQTQRETQTDLNIPSPFKDKNSKELFDFIVNNWNYYAVTKWGYIWNYFFYNNHGKLTNKTDYENYLRTNHKFLKGKPNYESCNSKKRFSELDQLKSQFLEK